MDQKPKETKEQNQLQHSEDLSLKRTKDHKYNNYSLMLKNWLEAVEEIVGNHHKEVGNRARVTNS